MKNDQLITAQNIFLNLPMILLFGIAVIIIMPINKAILNYILVGIIMARSFILILSAIIERIVQNHYRTDESFLVSVIIPAYNEEVVLAESLKKIINSSYKNFEILIIDDGSQDGTLECARTFEERYSNVHVISLSKNQGKAAALNHGILASSGDIIIVVDADTLLYSDAISYLIAPFIDKKVAAVAGNIKVGNRNRFITKLQSIEYICGLNIERRSHNIFGCITTVPGAVGAFRKSAVLSLGGYSSDTLTEDTDLTISLLRLGWKIKYVDKAIGITEAPETLRQLIRQRIRWVTGNVQCAVKHKSAMISGTRSLRLFGLPNFWYSNVFSILLLPITILMADTHSAPELALIFFGFIIFELVQIILAHKMDCENMNSFALLLPYILFRSIFFIIVYVLALSRYISGDLKWKSLNRTGALLNSRNNNIN